MRVGNDFDALLRNNIRMVISWVWQTSLYYLSAAYFVMNYDIKMINRINFRHKNCNVCQEFPCEEVHPDQQIILNLEN